jgi:hypothetical protein|tara:strand:+ start:3819 stop:4400 length:582 start_codon:yes stop_codon:yes gene_type:complete
MLVFNEKDKVVLEWLKSKSEGLVGESLANFNKTWDKVDLLFDIEPPIDITEEEIEDIGQTLADIDEQVAQYTKNGQASIDMLEDIKREFLSRLSYFTTLKSKFDFNADLMDDFTRKEWKATIAGKIVNETGASATQSFNLVEKDVRYTTLRKKAFSIKKYAKTLDNKADYYNKIFQALSQSISNLRTERNRTT